MTRQEIRCINHLEIEWLVNRVLADFQEPTPVDIELGYTEDGEWSGTLWVLEKGDGTSMGFAVLADEDDTAFLVRFAGEAWWTCPADGHRIGVIGKLGLDERSGS